MGQSASSQREREEFSQRDFRRFSQLVRERHTQRSSYGRSDSPETVPEDPPSSSAPRDYHHERPHVAQPFATLRRHISAHSIPLRGGTRSTARGNATRDEILYEQEERLLVGVDDLRMPQAPITGITAPPMPNRPSVISRLGSRLLPRAVTMWSLATEENARDHQRILRHGDQPQRRPHTSENRRSRRLSMLGSFSGMSTSTSSSNRPRQRAPISRPYPLMVDGSLPLSGLQTIPLHTPTPDQSSSNYNGIIEDASASVRRSRLERVRRSISSPIENLFSSSSNQPSQDRQTQTPPRRPSRVPIADETDYLLPPLNVADTNIDLDEPASRGFDFNDPRSIEVFTPVPESPPPWAQRWNERTPTVRRDARRVPNLLRGRSSRIIRRDDEAPLSRILQFTAAAIAAQLSGTPDAIGDMEPIGDDGLDGSLNTFVETLNNAATTAASGTEANRTFTTLPPMNFLRVFRFVNTNADRRRTQASPARPESVGATQASDGESDQGSDGRTVTLVVVGVRSVPSASINHDGSEGSQASLDALLSLPLLPPQAPLRNGPGGLLRHSDGRSRFTARRRASMGGVNPFPANYDSQRHTRMYGTSHPGSGHTTPVNTASVPLLLSESPPGPHPPPSTPADPGLSAQASGTTTPSRRPSSASAVHHTPTLHYDNSLQRPQEANTTTAVELDATQTVRQRRRSDSEFARHRDLGAGAARRNGVVEPDNAPSQSRSWLIYVVGTNLSEDHPAFATPSLFTDVSILNSVIVPKPS